MIDFNEETLISLRDAASILPRRRAGKRANVATLYRWTTIGVKGVVLESVQVGGCRCTSRAAIGRFFERLTAIRDAGLSAIPAPEPSRLPAHRRRSIEAAERKLAAAGI
jgi:hypothetical protein